MRIIIGCALSMIFSANCAYAAAPVDEQAKDATSQELDYGALVRAEVGKSRASDEANSSMPSVSEARRWNAYAQPAERRAVILPPHRSLRDVSRQSPEIRSVDVPAPKNRGERVEEAFTIDIASRDDKPFKLNLNGMSGNSGIY